MVDFPAPFCPKIPVIRFGFTVKETLSKALIDFFDFPHADLTELLALPAPPAAETASFFAVALKVLVIPFTSINLQSFYLFDKYFIKDSFQIIALR